MVVKWKGGHVVLCWRDDQDVEQQKIGVGSGEVEAEDTKESGVRCRR